MNCGRTIGPTAALLLAMIAMCIACGPAGAQNPNSCTTSGFSSYSYTTVYDPVANTTTYSFTFCNESPIGSVYVNIGEIFFDGLPAPVGTPGTPPGWEFKAIGPKLFYATTSNPWWKTPPAIKPDDCLTGFTYVISGMPDTDFVVFTHVQQVTDATGQTSEDSTWFDCSVEFTPPQNEPCIDVTKTADPVQVQPDGQTTYTIKVCNCGNVDLTVTSVQDTILGDLLDEFEAANGGSDELDIGECVEFDVDYDIQPGDPNPLENCVTVMAEDDEENEVEDTACALVVILTPVEGACVSITKTPEPDQVQVGDIVTYTYEVCNCGTVPLTVTSIEDSNPVIGSLLQAFINANGGSDALDVDECVEFTVDYSITQTDPTPLFNCVTVTAEGDAGNEVEDTDCARVDITPVPSARQCFRPVTFTQELWHQFGEPGNSVIPDGVFMGRFARAFARHVAFGKPMPNCLVMGDPTLRSGHKIVFDGSALGVARLCEFLPQTGPADRLWLNYHNPVCLDIVPGVGVTNRLAGEVCALILNIATNDARCMPRNSGCDLERFTLLSGPFRGRTVGQVLNIANCVLGGVHPRCYGLPVFGGYEALADVLRGINSNYALVSFDDFIDGGLLKPDRPFWNQGLPRQFVLPIPASTKP